MKYIVQRKDCDGEWSDTRWTNPAGKADLSDPILEVTLEEAELALEHAKRCYPDDEYRVNSVSA